MVIYNSTADIDKVVPEIQKAIKAKNSVVTKRYKLHGKEWTVIKPYNNIPLEDLDMVETTIKTNKKTYVAIQDYVGIGYITKKVMVM